MARFEIARKADVINKLFSNFDDAHLERLNIQRCKSCKGTGLGNFHSFEDGNYSWDGFTYCSDCSGTGYYGYSDAVLQINDREYYCKTCFGSGCRVCNYTGKIDWVDHCMGR